MTRLKGKVAIITGPVEVALANEAVRKNLMDQLPLQRFGKVEDVGYGVL
ncbi:hypothetical protein [Neobacillus vireti]